MRKRRLWWRFRRRRVRAVPVLPTLFTLANGVCGFLAILAALEGQLAHAAVFILLGMVFDAVDGQLARAMRVSSRFGGQLDSLCDAVTFGAAPAVLAVVVAGGGTAGPAADRAVTVAACFYFAAAVLRLARFNVETHDGASVHSEFHGLPTPGAAGMVASVALWEEGPGRAWVGGLSGVAIPLGLVLLGLLMTSRIRYPHLPNQLFRGMHPLVRVVELGFVAALLGLLRETGLAVLMAAYVAVGPLGWVRWRLGRRPRVAAPPTPEPGAEEAQLRP